MRSERSNKNAASMSETKLALPAASGGRPFGARAQERSKALRLRTHPSKHNNNAHIPHRKRIASISTLTRASTPQAKGGNSRFVFNFGPEFFSSAAPASPFSPS
jgi:hypothetical protein